MKTPILLTSFFISLLLLGNIFGALSDEQVIVGWTIFHPGIFISILSILLGHILLYRSRKTIDILIIILAALYFSIGLISIFLEYFILQYRGYGVIGYGFGIGFILLSIFLTIIYCFRYIHPK